MCTSKEWSGNGSQAAYGKHDCLDAKLCQFSCFNIKVEKNTLLQGPEKWWVGGVLHIIDIYLHMCAQRPEGLVQSCCPQIIGSSCRKGHYQILNSDLVSGQNLSRKLVFSGHSPHIDSVILFIENRLVLKIVFCRLTVVIISNLSTKYNS